MYTLPLLQFAPEGIACALIGCWRAEPGDQPGDCALEFTPFGELVYTQFSSDGPRRILLIYRAEGDELVTDQPTAPSEQRTLFEVTRDTLLLNGLPHSRQPEP